MSGKESKTEKPTGKRLRDAKNKGDVARSQDLAASFSLGITLLFFVISVPGMASKLIEFWRQQLSSIHRQDWSVNFLTGIFSQSFNLFLTMLVPLFLILAAMALFTNMIQGGGFALHVENLKFKFNKFNIFKGIKRIMFSTQSLMELLKSIVKVAIIGVIAFKVVKADFYRIISLYDQPLSDSLHVMGRLFLKLAAAIIIFLLVLSVVDYLFQKLQYIKKMKMTKQEIKDEYKQMEGDPKIKGKRRQIQFQRAMSRMMEKIPQADVVITNPTHFAVALKYEYKKMKSPIVIAKGKNLIALNIIERAKRQQIPIVENPPLARGLYATVELNQPIPETYFQPVAEVLAYIYKIKTRRVG